MSDDGGPSGDAITTDTTDANTVGESDTDAPDVSDASSADSGIGDGPTGDAPAEAAAHLTISPPSASLAVGSTQTFAPSGGVAPYTFSVHANTSGASLVASTGQYIPGFLSGTDVVRVSDAVGATADATITVTGLPGVRLWLEGDVGVTDSSGLVTAWADQGGTSIVSLSAAGVARPSKHAAGMNGRQTIQFNGTSNVMTSISKVQSIVAASGWTAIAVASYTGVAGDAQHAYLDPAVVSDTGSGAFALAIDATKAVGYGYDANNVERIAKADSVGNTPQFIVSTFSPNANVTAQVNNGTVGLGATGPGNMNGLIASQSFQIGANYNNAVFFTGDIAMVLTFNRALSGGEIVQAKAYATAKWGLP